MTALAGQFPYFPRTRYSIKDKPGSKYSAVDWNWIWGRLVNPAPAPSDPLERDGVIFSDYRGHLARSHATQREVGLFYAQWADFDHGDTPLEVIQEAVRSIMGNVLFFQYTTASAGGIRTEPDQSRCGKWTAAAGTVKLKSRLIIPQSRPIAGQSFEDFQKALNDALSRHGLFPDDVNEGPGQLCYLPLRGQYYHYLCNNAPILEQNPLREAARANFEARMALEQQQRSRQMKAGQRDEGRFSFLGAFRAKHPTEEVLVDCGFVTKNGRDWHHPAQSTETYSTRLHDDGSIYSLSGSVKSWGGRNGFFWDGFDLLVHLKLGGNRQALEDYARGLVVEQEAKLLGWDGSCPAQEHMDWFLQHGTWLFYNLSVSGTAVGHGAMTQALEASNLAAEQIALNIDVDDSVGNNDEWDLGWPPGLVGELAKWIYLRSSRPIKQFSIAAALYFFSVAGRRYNVNGDGLNLYMLLVADTGRGKGVVKSAIDRLTAEISRQANNPTLSMPFDQEVPVSEAGIRSALMEQNPICAYEEELGLTIKPLTMIKASSNDIGLRKVMTRLFDSGQFRKLGKKKASKEENTKALIDMPCFTLAGDTQPDTYKSLISSNMIDSGFAPRMIPFFYTGLRKYHNEESERYKLPPAELIAPLRKLLEYVTSPNQEVVDVVISPEAKDQLKTLDVRFTDKINAGTPGAEMYNRADRVILRIAALLALGKNMVNPVVDLSCMEYAEAVVLAGMNETNKILATGGGGAGESVRIHKLREAVTVFVSGALSPDVKIGTYKTPKSIVDNKNMINENYLIIRLGNLADFAGEGSKTKEQNVRDAIREAMTQGIIEESTNIVLDKRTKQKVYQIGSDW